VRQDIYVDAIELARRLQQVVGEKSDYYITLEQLEELLLKDKARSAAPGTGER
jgi:hypothetical protein